MKATERKKSAGTAKRRSFFDLSPEEREREVAQYDSPIDIERQTRPLSAKERAQFKRMQEDKPHVSYFINGGKVEIRISLDDDLMTKIQAYAKQHRTTLPKMVERGLRGLISFGA
jgi:hypothetical protein